MNIKFIYSGLIIAFFSINAALAENPPPSALRKIAIALGSGAADFAACGKKQYAESIRSRFETAVILCTDGSNASTDRLMDAFDTAKDQRTSDIGDVGGECLGSIKDRFDVFASQIKILGDGCE